MKTIKVYVEVRMLWSRKKAWLQNCMQRLPLAPFSTSFARVGLLARLSCIYNYCNISCSSLTSILFLLLMTCFEQSLNEGAQWGLKVEGKEVKDNVPVPDSALFLKKQLAKTVCKINFQDK